MGSTSFPPQTFPTASMQLIMKIQFLFQNESIFVLNVNTTSVNSVVSVIPAHMVLQSSAKACLVKANKVGVI